MPDYTEEDVDVVHEDSPVHLAFGLTYASYYCVPRMVLERMPIAWQRRFVELIEQLPETPTYDVRLKDKLGRYLGDPLRDYRRGSLPEEMDQHIKGLSFTDPHTAGALAMKEAAAAICDFHARYDTAKRIRALPVPPRGEKI